MRGIATAGVKQQTLPECVRMALALASSDQRDQRDAGPHQHQHGAGLKEGEKEVAAVIMMSEGMFSVEA